VLRNCANFASDFWTQLTRDTFLKLTSKFDFRTLKVQNSQIFSQKFAVKLFEQFSELNSKKQLFFGQNAPFPTFGSTFSDRTSVFCDRTVRVQTEPMPDSSDFGFVKNQETICHSWISQNVRIVPIEGKSFSQ